MPERSTTKAKIHESHPSRKGPQILGLGLGLMAKANRQTNTDRNGDVASSGFKCKWFMSSEMWARVSGLSRSQKLAKKEVQRKPNCNFWPRKKINQKFNDDKRRIRQEVHEKCKGKHWKKLNKFEYSQMDSHQMIFTKRYSIIIIY